MPARGGGRSVGRFVCPAFARSVGWRTGGSRGTAIGFLAGPRHARSRVVETTTLVEFSSELIEGADIRGDQSTTTASVDRRCVEQLHPVCVGAVECDAQRNRQRPDRVGVVVGQQPFDVGLLQPGDGCASIDRSSIDQGAPCSASRGRNGSAENASGPFTPSPFHSPVASISNATAGCTAVCQTTAW